MLTDRDKRARTLFRCLEAEEREATLWEEVDPSGGAPLVAGAAVSHQKIVTNLVVALQSKLHGSRCRAYPLGTRLLIGRYAYYPDIVVVPKPASDFDEYVKDPLLVAEVTSPSSDAEDRGSRLDVYRQITSIHTFLIVGTASRCVDVHTYDHYGHLRWRHKVVREGAIWLEPWSFNLSIDEIYEDVETAQGLAT